MKMSFIRDVTKTGSGELENEKWEQNITWNLALSVTSFPTLFCSYFSFSTFTFLSFFLVVRDLFYQGTSSPFLRREYLRSKIDWASRIVGSKFTVFALFYFVFEGNFPSTSPLGGAYIWRGDLTKGFLHYRIGGAYIWRGLISEFYGIPQMESLLAGYERVDYNLDCWNCRFLSCRMSCCERGHN